MHLSKVPSFFFFFLKVISAVIGYHWVISDKQLAHIKSRHIIQGFVLPLQI